MSKEYPKCHVCGVEMAEGQVLRKNIMRRRDLYVCNYCGDLISAVAHDLSFSVFDEISSIMGNVNETWKERLEAWGYKEAEAK